MFTELVSINGRNVINIKDVTNIYIRLEAEEAIRIEGISEIAIVITYNFYQKLCDEVLSRIDISDKRLTMLRYFDSFFIQSSEEINYVDLVSANDLKLLECKDMDESNLKNKLNESLYQNLYDFVGYILTLPHSSGCSERVFLMLSLMKNKLTYRLKVKSSESMHSAMNLLDTELDDWTPGEELVNMYRN